MSIPSQWFPLFCKPGHKSSIKQSAVNNFWLQHSHGGNHESLGLSHFQYTTLGVAALLSFFTVSGTRSGPWRNACSTHCAIMWLKAIAAASVALLRLQRLDVRDPARLFLPADTWSISFTHCWGLIRLWCFHFPFHCVWTARLSGSTADVPCQCERDVACPLLKGRDGAEASKRSLISTERKSIWV